ncbi:sensor histidine kinase [Branchiibius cervicis]|uniref:Sensor histidine kinase n=1 Tax=Branchiibius cervicis TaxID=908252 RepID=A0ABW2AVI9_9MICO
MAPDGAVTINPVAFKVTQAAFVVRLLALAAALTASLGARLSPATLLGCLVAGLTSYLGLTRPELLHAVRRHPSIALADVALISAATALGGPISPFVLIALTTALLLGLWLDVLGGLIVIWTLMAIYTVGLLARETTSGDQLLAIFVIPFVYLTLWYLGTTLRRALAAQDQHELVLRDAIATAAATQERTHLSRQLHDSAAKTVQAIMMASSALPTYVERDSDQAVVLATQIQAMSGAAVHELRQAMTNLRTPTSQQPLHEAVRHVVAQWQAKTGRIARVEIDPGLDTSDESVRYELLVVLQEALENVHQHAGAAETNVELRCRDGQLVLRIADDGKGADPLQVEQAAIAGHLGVKGLHERMARIGGRTDWHSTPGKGTIVTFSVNARGLVES